MNREMGRAADRNRDSLFIRREGRGSGFYGAAAACQITDEETSVVGTGDGTGWGVECR